MRVHEFEDAVWRIEGIRIVIRAPWNDQVGDYPAYDQVSDNTSLTQFLRDRVYGLTGDLDVAALNGYGEWVNGRTHLGTIRASYER